MSKKSIGACLLILFMISSCSNARNHNKYDSENTDSSADEIDVITPLYFSGMAEAPAEETVMPTPVMVSYEGDLLNIFFHPLIARPEIAFTGSRKAFFKEWYVTAGEFKKILDELYTRNYVLMDIDELYDVTNIDGVKRVTAKKLMVPEGKKPMVLSIDDLSYYDFVKENGSVHKLVIDEKGGIAAWTDNKNGGELSYDLDVVTIMEDFIRQHPDFSVRGAKGIIALTGYEGVLGYQTHELDDPGYSKEAEEAVAVANRLKELGWRFASHSWGHRNMPETSMSRFIWDADRWDSEVRTIVGDTDLFVYPFGEGVEHLPEKHKELRKRNFHIFFGVGNGFGYVQRQEYIFIDRRNIDGLYFRVFRNLKAQLFDIDKVIDKEYR